MNPSRQSPDSKSKKPLQDVNYGKKHNEKNVQKSKDSYLHQDDPQYGEAEKTGGGENYADRGYSQQTGPGKLKP